MIEIKGLSFSFAGQSALLDINLSITRGEKVAILGPNGSGKSTLLKVIAGLIFPQKGEYVFEGTLINKKTFKSKEFTRKFRKNVQIVFQEPDVMLFNPTVYDEIAFGLRVFGIDNEEEKVIEVARMLLIDKLLERSIYNLSGGEKQKVAIAACLVVEPSLLLLDEPTAYLDTKSTLTLSKIIRDSDMTVITAVHDIHTARLFADRFVALSSEHKKVFDGTFDELYSNREKLRDYGIHIFDDAECVKEEENGG